MYRTGEAPFQFPALILQEIAAGTELGQKTLAAMKPEERRAALQQAKLAPSLRSLPETYAKEGKNGSLNKAGVPKVEQGRVEVQVWLNSLPSDGQQQLRALGFNVTASLPQNNLLIGTVGVSKLNALIELGFVEMRDGAPVVTSSGLAALE